MIKITFNPLQLIILMLKIISLTALIGLGLSSIWAIGFDKEATYAVKLVEKTGSGDSRSFKMLDTETGRTASVYPTQDWFDSSVVGESYRVDLSPSRFNGWIPVWQFFSIVAALACIIRLIVIVVTWISENIHRLDRDVDVYIGENTFKSPIAIKRIQIHELSHQR